MTSHNPKTPPAQYPELLTPAQAAELLNVSEGTLSIWRWSGRYGLPYVKVGRKVLYRKSDLINWLEGRVRQLELAS
ncbi:MAG: helix-turn-helix domain-containing protein [Betaproteobacteria bacterium]|nr:helix-turn-helix domain-containing protein [Betaproteobacteria bacterium]